MTPTSGFAPRTGFAGLLAVGVLFSSLSSVAQQLQGQFYADKESYMVGEPVFFDVEIKNTGTGPVYLHTKNAGTCLDTYTFSVKGSGAACSASWNPGCADDLAQLAPGTSETGRWPLNQWFQFEREGTYQVEATRHIPVMSAQGVAQDFSFSSKFEVKLTPLDATRVQSLLQDFELKLQSSDFDVRHEALDVLATTAPAYFQDIALRLARGNDAFAALHAVQALGRINTPQARAAMGDVLTEEAPKTEDEIALRIRAIDELGHSGDASYESLIGRFLEDKNEHIQLTAMAEVAQLGKKDAVPQLQRLLLSSNPVIRKNAAAALRFSTTHEAVDVLIDSIPDKNEHAREQVLKSLTLLTGHSAKVVSEGSASPEKIQNEWRLWWRANREKMHFPDHLSFVCHIE